MIVTTRLPRLFGASAMAVWPFVLIVPERRDDKALLAHEQVHLDEQAKGVVRWWWKYLTDRHFRLMAEVRAYRRQIELRGISVEHAAHLLATLYKLDISLADAKVLLET
jgi:hypothetical protein